MSERNAGVEEGLRGQAADFFERAKKMDFGKEDAIAVGAVAGLGLATLAGYLAIRRHRGRVKAGDEEISVAHEPAQYMKDVASVVRADGSAASFPVGDAGADRLRAGEVPPAGSFLMQDGEVVRDAHHDPRYKAVAKWAIDAVRNALPLFGAHDPEQPPVEDVPISPEKLV